MGGAAGQPRSQDPRPKTVGGGDGMQASVADLGKGPLHGRLCTQAV